MALLVTVLTRKDLQITSQICTKTFWYINDTKYDPDEEQNSGRKEALDNRHRSAGVSGYDFGAERGVRSTPSARDTRLSTEHPSHRCRRLRGPPIIQKELFFQVW